MLKHLLILIILPLTATSQRLEFYYSGEIKLEKEEIIKLSNDNIRKGTDYQKALGNYLLAIHAREAKESLTAWQHYDAAYLSLKSADTVDHILESAILRNQGNIARDHNLHEVRAEKYHQALPAARAADQRTDGNYANFTTREASTLYNLGRAYKDAGNPAQALLTFEQLKKLATPHSKYSVRAYREIGMLMKEQKRYKESEANFYQAEREAANVSAKMKMWVYHDWASLYKEQGQYARQAEKLAKALAIKKDFRTLMDMGECLILQQKNAEAMAILQEAEQLYAGERLSEENIKVYDHLAEVSTDQSQKVYYLTRSRDELIKHTTAQRQIKEETASVAFANAIKEIERTRVKEKRIELLFTMLTYAGWVALLLLISYGISYTIKRRRYRSKFEECFEK